MSYREVLVHYLTRDGMFGERQEALDAIIALEEAVEGKVIDELRDRGLEIPS